MASVEGGQHKRPATPIPRRLQLFRLGSVHLFFFACAFCTLLCPSTLPASAPSLTPSTPYRVTPSPFYPPFRPSLSCLGLPLTLPNFFLFVSSISLLAFPSSPPPPHPPVTFVRATHVKRGPPSLFTVRRSRSPTRCARCIKIDHCYWERGGVARRWFRGRRKGAPVGGLQRGRKDRAS